MIKLNKALISDILCYIGIFICSSLQSLGDLILTMIIILLMLKTTDFNND